MVDASSVRRSVAGVVALVAVAAFAGGCTSEEQEPPQADPSPSASASDDGVLDFTVYGPEAVTDAYRGLADQWNADHPDTQVEVTAYPDRERAAAAVAKAREAGQAPDLFLADRQDLGTLVEDEALRRVDDLLAAREVDFGDGFSRVGLAAFSDEAALQCMPVDVSPLVVYYNPQLIELDQIADEGRAEITAERGWTIGEFGRAAAQPRRPGVRGLYVEPSLEQVAPFVWSGGGQVVDDQVDPTTLTLSDDASRDALERLLEVVRDPGLTFGQDALERRSALARFKAGRLGMLLGYRDLTAELRRDPRLTFDVMPLPVVNSGATIARITGACISADSTDESGAADFLAALTSQSAQDALAATGYVMPANTASLDDEAFLQAGQRPLHSQVFLRELRDVQLLPATSSWNDLESSLTGALDDLFYLPVIDPLEERLTAIDDSSVPFLDPEAASESPSVDPSPSSSPSSSPSD
ncbi:hypothetical protein ASG49_06175 [Marmoricola sp. Leaf446]|uniref:ABC transporter substrate-binding protein n=1 Tax=Marmoricola sp. Leaf446 TaxID=1736379 RepID=UPI0006FF4FE6|nr:extracellular solute-binding protein [Marmoricola sp. Leaf446]KQT94456.1 hypothetical protein ASG49_06175 [Marmoricola sp. Leaf446]